MKKVLSAIMSVAMVASFATTSAFAATKELVGDSRTTYNGEWVKSAREIDSYNKADVLRDKLLDDTGLKSPYWDNGTANDTNKGYTVEPDQDVYLPLYAFEYLGVSPIDSVEGTLDDADDWKLKVKKNEGSKMIKAVSIVDKNFGSGRRHAYIKIELNDNYTNDDNKIDLDLTITNNSKKYWAVDVTGVEGLDSYGLNTSSGLKGNLIFWVKNQVQDADADFQAGDKGVVVNPSQDDDNEIVWSDENDDLARLTFTGDSDVVKFFPKLSTVWDNNDYAAFFNNQDAFIFNFVANPYISTTSRALLEIYNPYIDEDGNATANGEDIVIYQVVDGELIDVTKNFAFTTNEDGDEVFQTKTRQLGTYIFAEYPVTQAVEPEPTTPVDPEPTTPDPVKPVPNTGRWA